MRARRQIGQHEATRVVGESTDTELRYSDAGALQEISSGAIVDRPGEGAALRRDGSQGEESQRQQPAHGTQTAETEQCSGVLD